MSDLEAERRASSVFELSTSFLSSVLALGSLIFGLGYISVVVAKSEVPFSNISIQRPEFILCGLYLIFLVLIIAAFARSLFAVPDEVLLYPHQRTWRGAGGYFHDEPLYVRGVFYGIACLWYTSAGLAAFSIIFIKEDVPVSLIFFHYYIITDFVDARLYKQEDPHILADVIPLLMRMAGIFLAVGATMFFDIVSGWSALFNLTVGVGFAAWVYSLRHRFKNEEYEDRWQSVALTGVYIIIVLSFTAVSAYGSSILPKIDARWNPMANREVTIHFHKIENIPSGMRAKNVDVLLILDNGTEIFVKKEDVVFSVPKERIFSISYQD